MELDCGDGDASAIEIVEDATREGPGGRRHLGAAEHLGEDRLVGGERRVRGREIAVADRLAFERHRHLDAAVEGDEPEARQSRIEGDETGGEAGRLERFAGADGQRTGLREIPARLGEPEPVAIARREVEPEVADAAGRGQACR